MAADGLFVVNFDSPIVVANDFCTLTCSKITVPEDRADLNEALCRTPLTQLFSLAINKLEEKLDARYRKTPWPKAQRDNPYMQAHFNEFLRDEMEIAMFDLLSMSPEGVDIASKAFCRRNTKQRIRDLLEVMALERGINIHDVVEENAGELIINFGKLSKEVLCQLTKDYYAKYGNVWVAMIDRTQAFTQLPMPMPILRTDNCISFLVESLSFLCNPDIFMLEVDVVMKPLSGALSLTDMCINNVAESLYSKWKDTGEDQEKSITVEVLEVPATLLPEITEKYRHFKKKIQEFFEEFRECSDENLSSSSDDFEYSDDSDEEDDDYDISDEN